ncbi:MAG: glycosyl hydrolase [Verrucomicrobiota bacterium]
MKFAPIIASLCLLSNSLLGEIISAGSGSYTTTKPGKLADLPTEIFRKNSPATPTPTNQWWSSVVWQEHASNLFAHPLAFQAHDQGLAVTYPGGHITANKEVIIGTGIPKEGDFIIGLKDTTFPSTSALANSDWFVTLGFEKDNAQLSTQIGHGSPFVFCRFQEATPQLILSEKPIIWFGKTSPSTIGLTIKGHHYGIFGSKNSTWEGLDSQTLTYESDHDYFSIALLPDNKPETLQLFAQFAHNHPTDSRVLPKIANGQVTSTYSCQTESLEGNSSGTIFALYPHQWKYATSSLTQQTFESVRGLMKVAIGESFTTTIPIQGVLPTLPREGIPDPTRMKAYLQAEAGKTNTQFKDTYWEGKDLGKLTTLAGIAEVIGEEKLHKHFLTLIQTRLENWFTASEGESEPLFYYNSHWKTIIGSPASYGTDKELNDHHFHYGYFIRAAAEVARHNPAWAKQWGPMVNLLVQDIANPKRNNPKFPYLRCFDLYAGHSWASGHARFGDGNNQESSSESLNAWYALQLWGAVTNAPLIHNTGVFLFNTERTAVEEYWFDVSNTNFPEDFPQVALGMVWGGKGAFSTWFSAKIDHIHGINWLPFTPASLYMGRFPDYVKTNHQRIISQREEGNDYNNPWGDLIVMFNALQDPEMAANYLDENPDCKLEGGNTLAFMYHWTNTLNTLGRNDASVTSDHPFVNVYNKNGKKTYAAFNFSNAEIPVTFSDGHTMRAQPGTVTTSQ